jgi:hypothetical protein
MNADLGRGLQISACAPSLFDGYALSALTSRAAQTGVLDEPAVGLARWKIRRATTRHPEGAAVFAANEGPKLAKPTLIPHPGLFPSLLKIKHFRNSTLGRPLGGPWVTLGWPKGHPWATQSQTQQAEGRNSWPWLFANCYLPAASFFKDPAHAVLS